MIIIDKNAKREVQVKYPDRTRVLFPNLDDGYISSNDIVIPSINAPISDDGVAVATINDGAEGNAISKLVIGIEPVQDLHGQSNPYPPGGEKNLLPMTVEWIKANNNNGTWAGNSFISNGVTFTLLVDDSGNISGINANGTATATAQITLGRYDTNGGSYTFSSGVNSGSVSTYYERFIARDSNGNAISVGGSVFIDIYTIETTKTIPSNTSYINGYIGVLNGTTVNNLVFKPMIRLSSVSDATFAPYSNICPISGWTQAKIYVQDTYDATADPTAIIDLNGTRYGGTLDVTTGVLTVDRGLKKASEISNWTLGNALNDETGFVCYAANTFATNNPNTISNAYKKHVVNAWENLTFGEYMSSTSLIVTVPTEKNTTALAKAYLNELDASFVYELAEPLTVQLTAQEITTLLGQNNIWADCGNVLELSYSANMNIRLQDLLDEKLDKPTIPGTLGQVLTSDGEGGQTWETPE